jgi:two-component system CheB/CheR fusion protein
MSAMAIARRGVYSAASLGEVDAAIVQKYFITAGDAYEVVKPLRELVVFARQDLVQDPPFVRLDLVSCRNVLIYFQNPLQERVLGTFHYALAPAGLLFLGVGERLSARGSVRHRASGREDLPPQRSGRPGAPRSHAPAAQPSSRA